MFIFFGGGIDKRQKEINTKNVFEPKNHIWNSIITTYESIPLVHFINKKGISPYIYKRLSSCPHITKNKTKENVSIVFVAFKI